MDLQFKGKPAELTLAAAGRRAAFGPPMVKELLADAIPRRERS